MTDPPVVTQVYDFATLTYTRTVDGVVVETRPLTPEETTWVTALERQRVVVATAAVTRSDLAAGLAALASAQAAASADIPTAQATAAAATADKAAALSLKALADALAVKAVPVLADIKALAQGVSLLCQYRADADGAIIALSGWRQAVDENAVLTDRSLTYLGHLAQAELDAVPDRSLAWLGHLAGADQPPA